MIKIHKYFINCATICAIFQTNKRTQMKKTALACAFVASMAYSAASDATVTMLSPDVNAHLQDEIKALELKGSVPIKSRIASSDHGRAELMLADNSLVSIAPSTEIYLQDFVDTPGDENIVLNMSVGTARFITGEINRKNPKAFIVNTKNAAITIRGTVVSISYLNDKTLVYLSQTSGLGVSVRDLQSGQSIELKRPGRVISVDATGISERAGTMADVAAINTALYGGFTPVNEHMSQNDAAVAKKAVLANYNPSIAGQKAPSGMLDSARSNYAMDFRTISVREANENTPANTPAAQNQNPAQNMAQNQNPAQTMAQNGYIGQVVGAYVGGDSNHAFGIYVDANGNISDGHVIGDSGRYYRWIDESEVAGYTGTLNADGSFVVSGDVLTVNSNRTKNSVFKGAFTSLTSGTYTYLVNDTKYFSGELKPFDITKIYGTYTGSGSSSQVGFDIDTNAQISNARFTIDSKYSASGGFGTVSPSGSFLISNFTTIPQNSDKAYLAGQFNSNESGVYNAYLQENGKYTNYHNFGTFSKTSQNVAPAQNNALNIASGAYVGGNLDHAIGFYIGENGAITTASYTGTFNPKFKGYTSFSNKSTGTGQVNPDGSFNIITSGKTTVNSEIAGKFSTNNTGQYTLNLFDNDIKQREFSSSFQAFDIKQISGSYSGSGLNNSKISFDVDTNANISNAAFSFSGSNQSGTNGSGVVGISGGFVINNFNVTNTVSNADIVGQFSSHSSGHYILNLGISDAYPGTFSKR